MVLEASCKDGGAIMFSLVDNLLGGLHSMVRIKFRAVYIYQIMIF